MNTLNEAHYKTFIDESVIIPEVIAERVARMHNDWLVLRDYPSLNIEETVNDLTDRAITIYHCNKLFREKVNGKTGREYLEGFMRHWSAGNMRIVSQAAFNEMPNTMKGLSDYV